MRVSRWDIGPGSVVYPGSRVEGPAIVVAVAVAVAEAAMVTAAELAEAVAVAVAKYILSLCAMWDLSELNRNQHSA